MHPQQNTTQNTPFAPVPEPTATGASYLRSSIPAKDPAGGKPGEKPQLRPALCALLMVAAADYFVYRGSGGLGFALFFPLLAGLCILAKRPRHWGDLCLPGGLLFLLGAHSCWQFDPAAPWVGLLLLFCFCLSLAGGKLNVPDVLASLVQTTITPSMSTPLLRGLLAGVSRNGQTNANLAPILIPLIVCVAFIAVFAMANSVVGNWFARAGEALLQMLCNITQYIPSFWELGFWLLMWFVAAALLFPLLKTTIFTHADAARLPDAETAAQGALAGQTARNTLVSVNLLFLLYNLLDANFLWIQGTLPEGLTYSDYAHRGVFWLTLALAMTSLALGIVFTGQARFSRYAGALRILGYLWIAQNVILGVSAFERLHLYFGFNGLTRMRILGAFGILLVLIGLIIIGRMIRRRKCIRWMIRQQLSALALAGFAYLLCPCDLLTASVNAHLIRSAKKLDNVAPAVIIARHPISAESIPALTHLLALENPNIPAKDNQMIRAGVAGVLLQAWADLEEQQVKNTRWTYRSLAQMRALGALREAAPRLKALRGEDTADILVQRFRSYTSVWY